MFNFRRITLFCLEKRLSKHKMTIFSKNLGGHGLFDPPGYAYACLPSQVFCVRHWVDTSRGKAGRERVGTAFPHLFHFLIWNELEAVLKWQFMDAFPHFFCKHYITAYQCHIYAFREWIRFRPTSATCEVPCWQQKLESEWKTSELWGRCSRTPSQLAADNVLAKSSAIFSVGLLTCSGNLQTQYKSRNEGCNAFMQP